MKCLIVLALAVMAQCSSIYPHDTPEVAAAKAAHLAEVQRAAAAVGVPFYPYLGYSSYAVPVVTPEGFIADTPDVAAAKAAHFAEKAKAASAAAVVAPAAPAVAYSAYPYSYPAYPYYSGYNGPLAIPVVTPSGYLADTPEVAAAKAAHFVEIAKAQALA